MKKQFKYGAILSYFSIAFNIIAGLLFTPWMISSIGQSQYGLYTLAHSLISLFLIDFGLSSATSRYLSKYNAEGDKEGAENFLGAVYKLYLTIDAVILTILTVLFFFLGSIYANLTPTELEQFKVVYLLSGIFSIINFPFVTLNGILTAYEKFVPLKMMDIVTKALTIGLTVIALLFGFGLYALVGVHVVVGIAAILIKLIIIKNKVKVKPNFRHSNRQLYKDIFSFSLWMTISSLAGRLVFTITPSILGMVATTASIAVFGIVTTIEGYSFTITTAINTMFIPKVSKIYAADAPLPKLNQIFQTVGKFQFAINGLIVAGFASVGKQFVTLWAGEAYSDAYLGLLLIIVPGLFFNSLQIADTALIVQNKVKYQALLSVATGCINVIFSFFLSSRFGVLGACTSIFIAFVFRALIMHIISVKVIHLDLGAFMKICYLRGAVPLIATICVGLLLNKVLVGAGWINLIIKAGIVCIVYLVLIALFLLNKNEKQQIRNKLKRKKQS